MYYKWPLAEVRKQISKWIMSKFKSPILLGVWMEHFIHLHLNCNARTLQITVVGSKGTPHNPMATQCNQSQYPNLDYNFAQPQLMAQPNFEDLVPTDTPSAAPTALQACSDHTFNPKCAHNLMATQCNQFQYLTSLNKICDHNPSASQNNRSGSATLRLHHTHLILGSMF